MAAVAADVDAVRAALAPRPKVASAVARLSPEFSSLPHAVAQLVFKKIPADSRARAALVCRTWRDAIAEPAVWTQIDLSRERGITVEVTDAVLRGATARARGQLTVLVLGARRFSIDALVEVLTAQQGTLRKLYWFSEAPDYDYLAFDYVEQLLRAVPQLPSFFADVGVTSVVDAARMLRCDSPFQALRVHAMLIEGRTIETSDADMLLLAAAIKDHSALQEMYMNDISLRTPAVFDAVAAAVAACGLSAAGFTRAHLSPASLPTLVRLLQAGKLTYLAIHNGGEVLFDAGGSAQIADAIMALGSLQRLFLTGAELWKDRVAIAAIMRAVTRHQGLQHLTFQSDTPVDQAAAGAALCELCAADSPSLRSLTIRCFLLGDAGMRPLLSALANTRHLRTLDCINTGMSEEFARDVFLPAIRANTSLRELTASAWWGGDANGVAPPAVLEAEALVAARGSEG
jgi:hypothetical protein